MANNSNKIQNIKVKERGRERVERSYGFLELDDSDHPSDSDSNRISRSTNPELLPTFQTQQFNANSI